jgi:hypothetical protein
MRPKTKLPSSAWRRRAGGGQLNGRCVVLLGGLGKRRGFLLQALEPQIPIGRGITICQGADLHINHCSSILAGFRIRGSVARGSGGNSRLQIPDFREG